MACSWRAADQSRETLHDKDCCCSGGGAPGPGGGRGGSGPPRAARRGRRGRRRRWGRGGGRARRSGAERPSSRRRICSPLEAVGGAPWPTGACVGGRAGGRSTSCAAPTPPEPVLLLLPRPPEPPLLLPRPAPQRMCRRGAAPWLTRSSTPAGGARALAHAEQHAGGPSRSEHRRPAADLESRSLCAGGVHGGRRRERASSLLVVDVGSGGGPGAFPLLGTSSPTSVGRQRTPQARAVRGLARWRPLGR